jgi:hypothetical protein
MNNPLKKPLQHLNIMSISPELQKVEIPIKAELSPNLKMLNEIGKNKLFQKNLTDGTNFESYFDTHLTAKVTPKNKLLYDHFKFGYDFEKSLSANQFDTIGFQKMIELYTLAFKFLNSKKGKITNDLKDLVEDGEFKKRHQIQLTALYSQQAKMHFALKSIARNLSYDEDDKKETKKYNKFILSQIQPAELVDNLKGVHTADYDIKTKQQALNYLRHRGGKAFKHNYEILWRQLNTTGLISFTPPFELQYKDGTVVTIANQTDLTNLIVTGTNTFGLVDVAGILCNTNTDINANVGSVQLIDHTDTVNAEAISKAYFKSVKEKSVKLGEFCSEYADRMLEEKGTLYKLNEKLEKAEIVGPEVIFNTDKIYDIKSKRKLREKSSEFMNSSSVQDDMDDFETFARPSIPSYDDIRGNTRNRYTSQRQTPVASAWSDQRRKQQNREQGRNGVDLNQILERNAEFNRKIRS